MAKVFKFLAANPITDEVFDQYLLALIPDNKNAENNTRTKHQRESVRDIYDYEANRLFDGGERRNWWTAYNAVTTYADHGRSRFDTDGNEKPRMQQIVWGSGADLKVRALGTAMQMAGVN